MIKLVAAIFPTIFLSIFSLKASANAPVKGDAKAGYKKAVACFACHGEKGISSNDLWPNLAGQKQGYLIKQTLAFKSGERKDPLMSPQVQALSEKDLEDITAYFAGLK